jgi:soluble lytic murein transglycosylase-like protein
MARIPVYQERQQASGLMRVPELRVPDAGGQAMGRAAQQMGQALSQTARVTNDIYQENSKAWASETASNEALHWTKRSEELKGMAGQGGAGYTQMLNQEYQKRANELLAQAPDDASRNYLAQNLNEFRRNLISEGMKFEVTESRVYRVDSQKKAVTNLAAAVYQNPDPEYAQQAIGQQHAVYDSLNLPPSVTAELKEYASTAITASYFQSLAKNNPAALNVMMSQYNPSVKNKTDRQRLYAAMQNVESANNPQAVSPVGATGLMQVMPETAIDPGFGLPNVFDFAQSKGVKVQARTEEAAKELLKDPKIGAEYGQAYMDAMLERYDGDPVRALAAYNWGPGRTDDWDGDMNKLPAETKKYIPAVLKQSGIKIGSTTSVENPLIANLPLAERITLMDTARENESAQIVESTASAVFDTYGPQTDTDAVELDLMNGHIDRVMAGNTPEERENAKALVSQYASAHMASASERTAARESGVWQQVLDGKSMGEIQASPEWGNLDGKAKASLIGQINSFRSAPTSPAQWAAYSDITSNPAELAAMSTQQILAMSPSLGQELTTQLIKDRAKLNTPQGLAKAKYDEDTFKVFASKAGLKVFDTKVNEREKEKIGQFKFAVENALEIKQEQLKRPLSEQEQQDVMSEVLSNKVYIDEVGRDPEVIMSLVEEDDMGDTYVNVGTNQVYLRDIPASSRSMIVRQLRAASMPVTEAAIAEVWVASQQQTDSRFEQIPE